MCPVSIPPASGIDPDAAAARYAEAAGRELEPGAVLVVYRLGADLFDVAVVRAADDRCLTVAERSAAIGGREFDALLLAYLSGRHRDAAPALWERLDDQSEAGEQLRAELLDQIRQAREQLSEAEETRIVVADAGLDLELTRAEVEASTRELVEQTVHLAGSTLGEAGAAGDLHGVLLAGGAARTPLVAAELERRFGLEPVVATGPVHTDKPAPAPIDDAPTPAAEPQRRGLKRAGVFAAVLLAVVAVATAFGTSLGDDDLPQPRAGDLADGGAGASEATSAASPETPTEPATSETASPSPSPDATEAEPAPPQSDAESEDAPERTPEAEPTGKVPNVTGKQTDEAEGDLGDAGFSNVDYVGEQRGLFDFSYDDCEVIEQDPGSGAERPYDTTITVTYSYSSGDGSDCID